MPDSDLNIFVRNKYTATITSKYGNTNPITFTGYQGDKVTGFVGQSKADEYSYSNNIENGKKTTYAFNGYYVDGVKIDVNNYTLPNKNITIQANWTVTTYYKVVFNYGWVRPARWSSDGDRQGDYTIPASIYVLENSNLDTTQYTASVCYKLRTIKYYFKTIAWNKNNVVQLHWLWGGNYDYDESKTITIDKAYCVYPVWYKYDYDA